MFDTFGVWRPQSAAESTRACRLAAAGGAVRLLPGIYVAPGLDREPLTRLRAVMAWCPDGVILGEGAAKLSYWRDAPVADIELSTLRSRSPAGVTRVRKLVEPEWIVTTGPFRHTAAAFTAAYLAGRPEGADHVDRALRSGVPISDILAAPLAGWPWNVQRRRTLSSSRTAPWSQAERLAHASLLRAGVTGWRANALVIANGHRYCGDIVFPRERLIVEIDGYGFHSGREAFERDRQRGNDLVLAGWRVLHFTWSALVDDSARFVAAVRRALAM